MQFDNQKTRNVADVVAKILAGESAKQEPQMLGEELVGNQHKIDANKNKKIDAHDFKLLRAQKDKEKANSQKFGKDVKEEAEQIDEISLKTATNAYVKRMGPDSDEKDPYGHKAIKTMDHIANRYGVKGVTKAAKAADDKYGIHDPEHNPRKDYIKMIMRGAKPFKKEAPKNVKEEAEQIDELSKDTLKSYAGKVVDKTRTMPQSAKKQKHLAGLGKAMDKMKEEVEELDEAMFPGTKEYEKKYGQSPQQKLKKKGDTVPTSQGEMKKTEKGVMHTRRFSEMVSAYQEQGLKFVASLVQEEPDNEEFTKEMEDQKAKMDGKKKGADVAKGSVQAVKVEEDIDEINGVAIETIDERSLSEPEMKKREEIVKSMKKKMPGFKERYGERAKEVMYATATKMAKKD